MRCLWREDGVCGMIDCVWFVGAKTNVVTPKMSLVPLDRTWHLAIRSLIRSEFVDSKCTRNIDWSLGCMVVRSEAPRLVGVCVVDSDGYLRYLVVRERERGKGWGSTMLMHCKSSISCLTCMTDRVPFYEKHGFVAQGSDPLLAPMIRMTNTQTNDERQVDSEDSKSIETRDC